MVNIFDIFAPKEKESDESDCGVLQSIPANTSNAIRRKTKKKRKKNPPVMIPHEKD